MAERRTLGGRAEAGRKRQRAEPETRDRRRVAAQWLQGELAFRRADQGRRDERRARERSQRAGAVRPELGAHVDDGVVERAAEEAEERVVGEHHRRRIEARDADHDARERGRDAERDAPEPATRAAASLFGDDGSPEAAEQRAGAGGEREEGGPAPEVANADPQPVQERRQERGAGEQRADGQRSPDRRERRDAALRGQLERGRDGRRARDDETARERLLVSRAAEERQKADGREDHEDGERRDVPRPQGETSPLHLSKETTVTCPDPRRRLAGPPVG